MKFSSLLSTFASIVSIIAPITTAENSCDPISKYTTEWFLANTRPEWRAKSFDSTALFYSSGLSNRAKKFARQANKVTIWEVWPCENYIIKPTRQNPLRCIMSNYDDEMTYFENMSRAFAMKAHNIASVMHRNIENPPMSTIWGRIELPVLQAAGNPGGVVDYIAAIDAEDGRTIISWIRNLPGRIMVETEAILQKVLLARDLDGVVVKEGIEERDIDACPIGVDASHPLW